MKVDLVMDIEVVRARLVDIQGLLRQAVNIADEIGEDVLAAHIEHAVNRSVERLEKASVSDT